MSRESSISQEQVSSAAEAIRAAGDRLTARGIRQRLGAGSMAPILKFFQAWKDAQVREPETPASLPPALQRGLLDFVSSEVDSAKGQLRSELDTINQANADLIVESERQALTIDNLTSTLEQVYADKAELSGRLEQVLTERDAANEQAATERLAAEGARTELAKTLLRLEMMPRLEQEITALRNQLEIESSARVAADQSSAVAEAKLKGSAEARAIVANALDELKAEHHELKVAHQGTMVELTAIRTELHDAHAVVDDLRTKLSKVRGGRTPLPTAHKLRPQKKG